MNKQRLLNTIDKLCESEKNYYELSGSSHSQGSVDCYNFCYHTIELLEDINNKILVFLQKKKQKVNRFREVFKNTYYDGYFDTLNQLIDIHMKYNN